MNGIPAARLQRFALAALVASGMGAADADLVAGALVEASLEGNDGEGIAHLPGYVEALRQGVVKARPTLRFVYESAQAGVLDGDGALGIVAGTEAMRHVIGKARLHGFGAVAVRHTRHNGALAHYTRMAAAAGLIGFTCTSGVPRTAPFGGSQPFLDNYLSYGIPAGKIEPLLLDTGLTHVDGAWIGDYRGYGLALVLEVLAGVLAGESAKKTDAGAYETSAQSQFYAAYDPAMYSSTPVAFGARMEALVADVIARRPSSGAPAAFLLPGEMEARQREERVTNGIPVSPELRAALEEMQAALGLKVGLD